MNQTAEEGLLRKPGLRRIAANTGWLVGDKLFRMGLNFLLVAWMARYLGTEEFGKFNYVIAFISLFSGFATLGIDSIAVRDLLGKPDERDSILGTALVLKAIGGCSAFIAMLIAVAIVSPSMLLPAAIAGTMLMSQTLDVADCWFQSNGRLKYTVYARNVAFAVSALFRIWLIVDEAPLILFLWAVAIEAILSGLFLLVTCRIDGLTLRSWTWSLQRARQMTRDAAPMLVSSLAILLYMRIDQVMLAHFAGFEQVGIFSAAVRLTELWYFVPVALMISLFPSIMRSRSQDGAIQHHRTVLLFSFMGWTAIVIATLSSVAAPWLVQLFYGAKYISAASILSIQAWMAVFVFFGVARGRWLLSENRQRDAMYVDIVGVILNVTLNLLLIPQYGAIGAAVASLITAIGANVIVALFSDAIRRSLTLYMEGMILPIHKLRNYFVTAMDKFAQR